MRDIIYRQDAIDTDGLDEEIRCEMCKNPMHTDRGCDGNCQYDEKLYERIMQILDERIKPLPSAQPEQRWIPPEADDSAKRLNDLIFDINPAEICSQIESDNLKNWCKTIQTEMKMAMVQLPCWGEGEA